MIIQAETIATITQVVFNRLLANIAMMAIYGFVTLLIITFVADFFRIGFDDTDGQNRSGLTAYTDCKTGVQYLTTSGSSLTPRLDASGKAIIDFSSC